MTGWILNLTLLRAFHAVAEAGGFSRAARDSGVSQPTLSAQVRALEQAHRANLFNRKGRGVVLTALGQSLHAVTKRLFAVEEEAAALLAGARAVKGGHLRVAADSPTHVMPLLAALKRQHPAFTFALRTGNSSDVLRQILDYEADVAVMAKRTSDPAIHSVRLRADRLVVFAPRKHAWGARSAIALQELTGRDLVIRERGSITREVFEARLAEAGVRPANLIEAQTREAVREAVAAGFGVGVVFESEFGDDRAMRALHVIDVDLTVEEFAICLEERRRVPLVRGFFDVVEQSVRASDGL